MAEIVLDTYIYGLSSTDIDRICFLKNKFYHLKSHFL